MLADIYNRRLYQVKNYLFKLVMWICLDRFSLAYQFSQCVFGNKMKPVCHI